MIPPDFFIPGTNSISLEIRETQVNSDGLQEHQLLLGVNRYFRPWFEGIVFSRKFFHYGIIFLTFLIALLLIYLLIIEWQSERKPLYFRSIALLLSSLVYSVLYSGAFASSITLPGQVSEILIMLGSIISLQCAGPNLSIISFMGN